MTPVLRIVERGSGSRTSKMFTHFAVQMKRDKWLTAMPITIVKYRPVSRLTRYL